MRFNSQQILSYYLDLASQNPGLKEVDFETSPKRGSDKINMLKSGKKIPEENKSYRSARTHVWILSLRELDFEPSAKRGANRTTKLVSLYRSS